MASHRKLYTRSVRSVAYVLQQHISNFLANCWDKTAKLEVMFKLAGCAVLLGIATLNSCKH